MVKLIFTSEYANIFFLVNGLAILFYLGAKKKKRQRAMKFGNYETLQKVAGKNFLKSSNIMLALKMLALTALVVGISNPVLQRTVQSTDSSYVIALDSSTSMLADDLEPTRFEAAKEVSNTFVGRLSNETKVGVVSFAGSVSRESELTSDHQQVRASISNAGTGSEAGTSIGDALHTSTSMLLDASSSRRVILVTDGRNNAGISINESLGFVRSNNVTVNAIGIGEQGRETESYGIVEGENASRASYPNLDTEQLYQVTNSTGGELVTVSNRSGLERAFLDFEETKVRQDISQYFIFLAVIIMLIEWTLGTTRFSILP